MFAMSEKKKDLQTPMLKQYWEIKAQYPDAILLYRVGDFYETFGEDAVKASRALGIVLTRKAAGNGTFTELAGVPFHALETYLPKLVGAGYKVAVCDQLEDPKLTKKIVRRGVTELVTPGVAYNDTLLRSGENNYLAALSFSKDRCGAAFLDISTGSFKVAQGDLDYIEVLLGSLSPKELIMDRSYVDGFRDRFGANAYITPLDSWPFAYEPARRKLCTQLGVDTLKGFGIEQYELAVTSAGAVLFYLEMTKHDALSHIRTVSRIERDGFVWMDRFTFRNLEVFNSLSGPEGRSLVDVIDRTSSPMGARLLREWLAMPLRDAGQINGRYDQVESFLKSHDAHTAVRDALCEIGDLERIVAKAAAGKLLPREALQMARSLKNTAIIKDILAQSGQEPLGQLALSLDSCSSICCLLENTLLPDAAAAIGKGDVIAPGVDSELDSLREVLRDGKQILLDIQQREKDRTGISSLKISYNNVFGYYLEVRNTFRDKVPEDWIRKQTLVGAERYITPELKQYEERILGAEEKILALETRIYASLVETIRRNIAVIQNNSSVLARIDVISSFALAAYDFNYCRPELEDSKELLIEQGRHPVIERMMGEGEEYVANDLYLENGSQQIIILTGPNMAGKSAFLRQTALICLLAQIGSFVPAKAVKIGIVDKIFTRVGASDNISRGESTFMVEMLETATILNNLSERSLILLDEIGRGTSTFDGMSIAWAIVEFLHNSPFAPKCLFATHYHELNELEALCSRVHNYHISVKESDGKVIFLRKLCKGGVAHSFGIHVAKLAGMPAEVVQGAQRKLKLLESASVSGGAASRGAAGAAGTAGAGIQLSLYQLDDPLLLDIKNELKNLDINKMSPLDAFDAIRGLKKKIGL